MRDWITVERDSALAGRYEALPERGRGRARAQLGQAVACPSPNPLVARGLPR